MSLAPVAQSVPGAFSADGDRWRFAGMLTFDDATAVLAAAKAMPLPASGRIDLSGLTHADSAGLAVLLALRRRAQAEGRTVSFEGMPPVLASLARVYGIEAIVLPA
ncbi:MAG: STAS domain-containing protein [Burkholderiales bacterium]